MIAKIGTPIAHNAIPFSIILLLYGSANITGVPTLCSIENCPRDWPDNPGISNAVSSSKLHKN